MKLGETLNATMKREVLEETGYVVKEHRNSQQPYTTELIQPDDFHYIILTSVFELVSEQEPSEIGIEKQWFATEKSDTDCSHIDS